MIAEKIKDKLKITCPPTNFTDFKKIEKDFTQ
jgi:hypothetical protein